MEIVDPENPNITNRNTQLLTIDDLENGAPVRYDAMVLYAEANQRFVDDLALKMNSMGFRLFTGYRTDLAPGEMPHGLVCELIASRCHNIIVIYSPEFFSSDEPGDERRDEAEREVNENQYYAAYALATKIASKGEHRMIPCVYEECALPEPYRHNFMLFCRSDAYNFYQRLAKVLGTAPNPREQPPNSMAIVVSRKGPSRAKYAVKSSVGQRIRRLCRSVTKRLRRSPQSIKAN